MEALAVGLIGVAQGLRHALEPDHVTAVATLVAPPSSAKRSMAFAASWGVGHGAMLLLLGGGLAVSGVRVPARLEPAFEILVGVMLVVLGLAAFRKNATPRDPAPAHRTTSAKRPLLVGAVHGLAGSTAVAALVAIGSPTPGAAIAALALYAFGATLGMVLLAALAGPVLARAGRQPRVAKLLVRAAGGASVVLGIAWAARSAYAILSS